jgi:hypothetical protein
MTALLSLLAWIWTPRRVADLTRLDALRLLLGKDATRREGR